MIKILPNLTWSGMEVNEGYNKPLSNTILLLSTSSKLELDQVGLHATLRIRIIVL
jgi:hypothetical protein